jgi:hypothetical protein
MKSSKLCAFPIRTRCFGHDHPLQVKRARAEKAVVKRFSAEFTRAYEFINSRSQGNRNEAN